tara:strand:- start:1251 stop:2165 length:915 start_codon:yes stop_codon:yes gene_type:complete
MKNNLNIFTEGYAHNKNIDIFYRDYGPIEAKPILLVQGLGGQLTYWPDHLLEFLIENNYRPIVYDNRDVGKSSRMSSTPVTWINYLKYFARIPIKSEYLIDDMASDAIALLDHLEIFETHLLGLSMGGMIAQIVASNYGDRISSYTQISSTPYTPSPWNGPSREVRKLLMSRSKAYKESIDERINRTVKVVSKIGLKDYEFNTPEFQKELLDNFKRGGDDRGFGRHIAAILASKDRLDKVSNINVPTLIIHGEDDPLIRVKNAKASHRLIKNSKLKIIPKMRHLIEPPVFDKFKLDLLKHLHST